MIRKFKYLLFGVFFLNNIYSQSQFEYSFDIEPIYSYRTYRMTDASQQTELFPSGNILYSNFKLNYDKLEKPKFGYGMNLNIGYNFNPKTLLRFGIGYKNIGEKIVFREPDYYIKVDGQTVISYKKELSSVLNSYEYLSIPIDFQYKLFDLNKISFEFSFGTEVDLKLFSTIQDPYSTFQNPSINFSKDTKSTYGQPSDYALNLHCGLVLNYKIKDNLTLFFQPEFARYITPNVKYNLQFENLDLHCKINQYNYYGQLKIGVKFRK